MRRAVGEDHEGGDALGAGDRAAHRAQVLEQRLVGRREAGGGAVDEQAAFPRRSRRRRRSGSARSAHPLAAEQDRLAFLGQAQARMSPPASSSAPAAKSWRSTERQTRCDLSCPTPKVFKDAWPLRRIASVSRPTRMSVM